MKRTVLWVVLVLASCDGGSSSRDAGPRFDAGPLPDAGAPSDTCGSVRLTAYTAGAVGWCELDRTHAALPTFVQSGLTAAIAEPWNGGSYGGDPGEACGECWEIDTIASTEIVMITDLCPIEGNPLCAGAHFHLDLAEEAGAALETLGLFEGSARRVPCPVSGNAHVLVIDQSDGYMRLQFLNHRIPIRTAEVRAAGTGAPADAPWIAIRRDGGAWEALDGADLARGGTGVVFRITSAQGQTVESTAIVPARPAPGSSFDLGVQLDDVMPSAGAACVFEPPATIYADGFGGIDQLRWDINPWSPTTASETTDGCVSGSCLRVDGLAQWSGFHLYYRQPFPSSTYARFSMQVRTTSGAGEISITPAHDNGDRCASTTAAIGADFTEVMVDVAAACAGVAEISMITIDNPGPDTTLFIDDARFQH